MRTTDILLPTQRHVAQMHLCIDEFAGASDSDYWTEAAVTWGKLIAHAQAICELEYPMRTIIMEASHQSAHAADKPLDGAAAADCR